jgi:hypothetical protein
MNTFKVIFKNEGLKGFYIGYKVSMISNPTFYSIFFTLYELTK